MKRPILFAILISLLVIGGIFAISTFRSQSLADLVPVLFADNGDISSDTDDEQDADIDTDADADADIDDVDTSLDVLGEADEDIESDADVQDEDNLASSGGIIEQSQDNSVTNIYAESAGLLFDLAMNYHFEYLPEFNRNEVPATSDAYMDYVFMTNKDENALLGYIEKEQVDEIITAYFPIDSVEHISTRAWIFDGEVYASGTPKTYGTLPIFGVEAIEISEVLLSDLSTISSTNEEIDTVDNVDNTVDSLENQPSSDLDNVETDVENLYTSSEKVTLYKVTIFEYIFPEFDTVSPDLFIASNTQDYSDQMSAVISQYGTQLINGEISVLGAIRTMIIDRNTSDFTTDGTKQIVEFTYDENGKITIYSNTYIDVE